MQELLPPPLGPSVGRREGGEGEGGRKRERMKKREGGERE